MKRRMQGFSMVELMVAIALGLLISAAAIQLFLANQISLNFQRGMNDVQANGRFAIDQMTYDTRMSGLAHPQPGDTLNSTIPAVPMIAADIPGLPVASTALNRNAFATTAAVSGLLQDSDQLVTQRAVMNASGELDCEGNSVPAFVPAKFSPAPYDAANPNPDARPTHVVSRYYIRTDSGVPSLVCDGGYWYVDKDNVPHLVNYGAGDAVLLNGVDSFQVLFGVDDRIISGTTNGVPQVARYMNPAAYALLPAPQPRVVAVRLGIYLHSMERAGNVTTPGAAVQVLDVAIPAASIPNDGLLRRLFINTVSLRNIDISGV
jgi:type IV pilus assembly protein PilW